jgi:transcriptional regulator with AAA-type ATPase domain
MLDTSLIKAKGQLELKLLDANGNIKELRNVNNLIVTKGLEFIVNRLRVDSSTLPYKPMTHMAIGTTTNAAAPTAEQTALLVEAYRIALDSTTIATQTVTNDTIQYVATFAAGNGTGAITEAGIFNDAAVGTANQIMLCRTVFSVINKGAADTLAITWRIKMTSA